MYALVIVMAPFHKSSADTYFTHVTIRTAALCSAIKPGGRVKKIQVLGTGCPKCTKLYETALQAVRETSTPAEVTKVDDINDILNFGVMMTPALVIDGAVKVVGRVPGIDEIKELLQS
jgi:small redox-active disulfide protein 2